MLIDRFNDPYVRAYNQESVGQKMSKEHKGMKAYGEVRDQQIKQTSNPEVLIKLLFDKACVLVRASTESLEREDHESFQKSCLHARNP